MRLGPYELVRRIGSGGMGEVWLAQRNVAGAKKLLALKRLPRKLARDPRYRRILLEEARLSMMLTHSNVVHVFDAGEVQGEAYIAMEFVDGEDLSRLLKQLRESGEHLSPELIAHIIAEVLRALSYAHELVAEDGTQHSLVHRDVSPHNVILSTAGEVKLADFGVARLSSEDTSGTHVKGKIRYMPPEQLRGESRDPKVDLFAIGAVMHELFDGELFRGELVEDARLLGMVMDGVVPEPLEPKRIPWGLERVRRGLLETDPAKRIESARVALEQLYAWDGYRNASLEVAELVKRVRGPDRGIEVLLASTDPNDSATHTALGSQATFLHTDDAIALGSELLEELPNFDVQSEPLPDFNIAIEDDDDDAASSRAQDEPGEATTAVHDLEPEAPTRSARKPSGPPAVDLRAPELGHTDLGQRGLVRHVATSPNPTIPVFRRYASLLILLGVGVALVVGGWLAWPLIAGGGERGDDNDEGGIAAAREARVLGDRFGAYAGFRHPSVVEALAEQGIRYEYDAAHGHERPLAALDAGEAEFVLTTLDQVLRERPAGKIVAVVNLSIGGDALVLDSVEHPELDSLADLASWAEAHDEPARLALAGGTPSEHLAAEIRAAFTALDPEQVRVARDYDDAVAVWRALEAEGNPKLVAAVLWEPLISEAREAGMTVALSTRDLPRSVIDVLVASDRVLAEDPELVEALVTAYYTRALAQQREPEALRDQVAEQIGVSPEQAAATLAGTCILDARGAEPWFVAGEGPEGPTPSLLDLALQEVWTTLGAQGSSAAEPPSVAELVDDRGLQAALKHARKATPEALDDPAGELPSCLARVEPGKAQSPLGPLRLPTGAGSWFTPALAELAPTGELLLDELAVSLRDFNPQTISVELTGYGDGRGRAARKLGEARAEAVAAGLRERGLELEFTTRGQEGGDAPLSSLSATASRR